MNRLKKLMGKGKQFRTDWSDPIKKPILKAKMKRMPYSFRFYKNMFIFSGVFFAVVIIRARKVNPWASVSRTTGFLANSHIPKFILTPLISLY